MRRSRPSADLPTPNGTQAISPVAPSPPFRFPHAVHPCPSVDSGLAFFGVTRNWDCQRLSCGSRIRNILPSLGQAQRPRPFITLSPPCPRLARGFYEQIMFQLHFSKATASTVIKSGALRILPPALHRPLAVAYRAATLRWVRGVPVRPAHVGSLRTWSGVSMSPLEVTMKLAGTGFEEISILDDPGRNHRFWAIGKKPVLAG